MPGAAAAPARNGNADSAEPRTRTFRTTHEVFTDLPDAEARPFAQHMDTVYAEYAKRLKAFPTRDSKLVRLYLYSDIEQYLIGLGRKGFNASNTGGVFFRTHEETALATFVRGNDRRRMLHVLQHEGSTSSHTSASATPCPSGQTRDSPSTSARG